MNAKVAAMLFDVPRAGLEFCLSYASFVPVGRIPEHELRARVLNAYVAGTIPDEVIIEAWTTV